MKKTYRITKDCFVGKVGDIIVYDSASYCGDGSWHNITKNTAGSPFIEFDCVTEATEREFRLAEIEFKVMMLDLPQEEAEAYYRYLAKQRNLEVTQ